LPGETWGGGEKKVTSSFQGKDKEAKRREAQAHYMPSGGRKDPEERGTTVPIILSDAIVKNE